MNILIKYNIDYYKNLKRKNIFNFLKLFSIFFLLSLFVLLFIMSSKKIFKKSNLVYRYFHIGLLLLIVFLVIVQTVTIRQFNKSAKQKLNSGVENAFIGIKNDLKIEVSFLIGINPSSINWDTDDPTTINILWSNIEKIKQSKINKIIEKRLLDNDITQDFEYRIIGKNLFQPINSAHFSSKLIPDAYQKALTFDGTYTLFIYIKNKDKIISQTTLINIVLLLIITILAVILISALWISFSRIKSSNETKTDFINNMTHELKTPISTISITVDLLQNPKVLNNKDFLLNSINIIKSENQRMHQQVEKILEAAKYYTTELELEKDTINVNILLKRFVRNFRHRLDGDNHEISISLKAENDLVLVDEVHFANVLNNLLDNAVKYSKPEFTKIQVTTVNPDPDNIEIIIKDHGIGMKKDVKKQVFDKFYRAPTGSLHNVKGFGLGLSYVKTVIDAHDAKISIKSKINIGTAVHIIFPLIKGNESH